MKLRDGSTTDDPRLDRLIQFDPRSRVYNMDRRLGAVPLKSKVWTLRRDFMGDQGKEGACVEYGLTHELGATPVVVPKATLKHLRDGHRIYWPAQLEDPWPGGSYIGASPFYEGTSVLAGVKVVQRLGYCDSYHWAFDIDTLVQGVVSEGPAVLGINYPRSWFDPRPSGLVEAADRNAGGHCMAMTGVLFNYRLTGETRRMDVAVFPQSWGLGFGDRGRIYVELSELESRMKDDGEAVFLTGRRIP
jgi:hypothetical protein